MRGAVRVILVLVTLVAAWRSWVVPSADRARPDAPPSSVTRPLARPSQGDRTLVDVPFVIGLDDSFAKHLLERTHLRLGRVRLRPSRQPWGSVLVQSIGPGEPVPAGTRVDLVLAQGSVPQPCRRYWCATGEDANASE